MAVPGTLILIVVIVVLLFVTFLALISRYKRCPSDKILVIYGKTGGSSAKCIHGGGAFVWPVIQDYAYLDLKPISIEANLTNALSKQNIRVDVPCRFTIAISTEPDSMGNAAERLLGLGQEQIQELSKDILFGQLRLVIATMTIEEINSDRDKFLDNISKNVDAELKKIGLKLINVNVTDIKDESGYIEALGKEAAAKAINEAKISVAEQERIGETGKASADREKDVVIAETNRDRDVKIAITQKDKEVSIASAMKDESIGKAEAEKESRIATSLANSLAVKGENEAKITIANSDAERREKEAEALRLATAAEKVQTARALEESYVAEQKAEAARAERERSTQQANIVVPAEIAKQKAIIDAQAEAEKIRLQAKGEADAIFAKMEAEAKGLYEILTKQAEGYDQVVKVAGGDANKAFQLLLIEKLPELVRTQVEAVKNIKIDKVTVWDSGNGQDGNSSTANFVSGMMKTVPPLNDLFNMAGLNLPDYLKGKPEDAPTKKENKIDDAASDEEVTY
ncbi:flotillin family protein [Chryseobacterium potabilaquae]|uniref:Inner membrane protein YqiK n=1 Tax=Chryseobacterium potabilaquae TaxID=2675057 RepID=A0A6N4XAD3_9FLAO|nr:flotillin family protein [Chryseobacterium potabilaquae]CAA7196010.1 Inner membrane protein YqiK [Chryseobacterium potabilaquae]